MMHSRHSSLSPLLIAITAACVFAQTSSAQPFPPGTAVTLFLDASGNLPEPDPGPPTDMLVFTGGRTFVIEIPGCSIYPMPLQNAVLVDSDGGRSSRMVSVIVETVEPVPPGTRLSGFVNAGPCTSGGIPCRKYAATVK